MDNYNLQRAKCYSQFLADFKPYKLPIEKEVEENKSLMDIIYSRDSNTGLPVGDLALFMNDNTSLEVRQYIQQNLLAEQNADSPSVPYDCDIDLTPYIRMKGESRVEYMERLNTIFQQEKAIDEKERETIKFNEQ